jgi:hypothetical protein
MRYQPKKLRIFFGLKVSKNGYRYDKKVGAKVAKNVLELYKHVTRKWKVTNGQINKCFACGVISWLKHGTKLDWEKYVVYYYKYNVELKETKTMNFVQQAKSGAVGAVKQAS